MKVRLMIEDNPARDEHVDENVVGLFAGALCLIGVGWLRYQHCAGGVVYLVVWNYMIGLEVAGDDC